MARSLSHEYHKSLGETYAKLSEYNATLRQVFDEDPEIVLHDDPAKWAEIFAVRFGWAEKRKIEFVWPKYRIHIVRYLFAFNNIDKGYTTFLLSP